SVTGATRYALEERKGSTGTWEEIHDGAASSKAVTGKSAGTWQYRARACSAVGCSSDSGIKSVTVAVPAAPATPTGPTGTEYDGAYTISWSTVTGATRYELDERLGNTGTWKEIHDGTDTSKDVTDKSTGTWQYRARACSAAGCSGSSGTKSVTVSRVTPPVTPNAPSGPSTTQFDGAYFIWWRGVSGATSYTLQERLNDGEWKTIQTGSSTSRSISGKTAGTWHYRVRAENAGGNSDYSGTESITVAAPSAPSTPSGPSSTDTDGDYFITWSSRTGATKYVLEERLGSTGTWAEIHDGATRSKRVTLRASGTWQYRVKACSVVGCGDWSRTKSVVVELPDPPPVPTSLRHSGSGGSYLVLWGISTGATRYVLQEKPASGIWTSVYDGSLTFASLTGRSAGTYSYQARACIGAACSAWSTSYSVTVSDTPQPPSPPPPSTSTAVDVTDSGDPSGFLKYVPPSGSIPGLMPGQYSVNRHGGFNYEIPIQVPPGTAGMEPELSLRYDSHARNGLLGVGWRLSGISRITRCRATEVNDDYSGGISFDSNDRFCLDGQRLIAVSGTYGANNTEYRTEVDRIRKVVSYGTAGSGPQYFKVWNKNGHVTEYGNTADSRIEAVGKTDVLVWTANKLQDSSGNYLTYRYTEDSTNGDHRINRIDYTGHAGVATYSSVRFSYEARTDQPPEYYDGSKHKIQQRLTHIKTYSGTALVMDYRIAYDNAGAAGRSRITSVKACDSAENCMEPTEFSWQSGGSGSYPSATTATLSTSDLTDYETFAEDLDGDGLSDILATKIGSTGFFSRAALRNANGTFGTLQSDTLSTASQSGYVSYFGDLDADGHLDLVAVLADSSGLRVKTALGTGTGTFSNLSSVETLYRTRDLTDYVVWVRDMNNDGYDDIILSLLSYGLYIGVALGDGDGTFQALTYGYYTTFRDGRFAGIGDVDGDRIGDVAIIYTRDRFLIDVISGDGDGTFANAIRTTAGAAGWSGSQAFLEDVNGDGLSDVVLTLAEDEDGSDGGMQYGAWFSEGDGTFDTNGATQQLWSSDASAYEDHAVEDINADGYPDLIYAKKDTSGLELKAAVGNGDGTFGSITTSSVSTTYMLNYAIRATDADGDGLTDVVVANADSTGLKVYTSQASGNRPDLITQVVDGYDVDTDIAYAPITDDGVYTKGSSATYPAMDVQDASHVVKSVVTDNGTGGRRTTNYKYQGAQVHLEGRGWLGFSAMEATETAYSPDIVTRTNYSLAFPYIGMVTSMERRLTSTSGRKLQTYEATLANLTTMTGKTPKFPYVSSGVTKTYDLAKALLNTETLVSTETVAETYKTGLTGTYPTFANLETLKVTRTGGAKTFVTHHKYQHTDERTAGWLLGRITRQEITEYLHGYSGATDGTCSATSTTCDKRTTNFVYDTDEWLVTQEVLEPDNAEWKLTSTNTYDTHGNLDSVAVSGGSSTHETNITSRTTDPRWDARGQFMNRLTNAKSHHTTYATDAKFGVVTTETDPNGDSTVRTYDTFGRLTRETRPGGSVTNVYRAWCTSATCPTDGKTKEVTTVSGQPAQAVIYDALGRETLRATVAWTADSATAANIAVVDTQYDTLGNVWKRSRPYFHNATPVWHVFQYDVLHRQTRETAPGSRATSTVYAGLQSTVTNAKSQDTKYTRNVRGELVAVEDEDENSIAYTYDPFGNLLTTVDSENNTTTNTYNIRGFRESTRDPDAGLIDYEYNVLGELVEQTDAKSQTIAFVYDVLGRMTERDDIEGTGGVTTWTYDTATNGKGRIHTVDGSEGDDHTYTYDGSGRLTRHRTTIDSTNYDLNYTYDSSSRLDTLQYPASARHSSGLTVRYNYTDEGHLEDVRNTAGNALFWEIDGAGADGQLTGETFGNDVSSVRRYDANTGFLTDIESGEATATDRQNERYEWDKLGNLTKRYDDLQSLSETFAY
ncbi:MAG: FG-GAP-like repeat-containing protein, partial [Rhodospirillaceae bacterium]|nr:FG-GAP-like repeat-containing protein [Rhodospirillaceae bacterium]